MPIARKFMDWSQPALPAVADYLCRHYRRGRALDLDRVALVFPGGRAGRRMLEVLVEQATQRDLVLVPPHICTVGQLPELLYESKRPFATEFVQQLAWVQALRDVGPEESKPFIPRLPAADDFANWMELGALLQRQHRELAADALNFAEVATRGQAVAGFRESSRWRFLSVVQGRYLAILDALGLWDQQTARLFAIEHRECCTDKDLVLVATTDMNMALRRMLDQVADRVTALIHAPPALADRFDAHGCLIPECWQDAQLDLQTRHLRIVSGPADQADAVIETIAGYQGRYRADQIAVGVLDEQLVPHLIRRLEQAQLPARWVVGKTLRETAPFRLLQALSAFIQRRRFADLAALVRHPDVSAFLDSQGVTGDWLTELDNYFTQHLPPQVDLGLNDTRGSATVQRIVALITGVVEPLTGAERSLGEWSTAIARSLLAFYGDRVLVSGDPVQHVTLKSLQALRAMMCEFQGIPAQLSPQVSVSQAIEQLLKHLQSAQIPSTHIPGQIELLGWLELPLDMAPALVATSFNEGCVPTSVNSDLFLPNTLRQQLDLLDNRRRYARDAYALSVLTASREELLLIAGRRTVDGDPLLPSRLAFATDSETMARRARAFFSAGESVEWSTRGLRGASTRARSQIVVPRPVPLEQPITTLGVTAFKSYLACPYRFYLRHVLGLANVADAAEELGPDTFGTLLHDVLKRFGRDPIHEETDADAIRHFLHHALNQHVTEHFGTDHLPALAIQVIQARARLDAFATWQAERTQAGWQITHCETSGGDPPACLHLGHGISLTLHGRIDRIDHRDGQWAILDYKTGDTVDAPQKTHYKAGTWKDLQLPLYLHLARTLHLEGPMQVGYIALPKDVSKTAVLMADWNDDMLASADATALEVAQHVYDQEFWPPKSKTPDILREYAAICQDQAMRRNLEGDEPAEATT